jgi:hypothetical protein
MAFVIQHHDVILTHKHPGLTLSILQELSTMVRDILTSWTSAQAIQGTNGGQVVDKRDVSALE